MLISCEYQGTPCYSTDFYPYHDYHYGNCFRFNGLDPNASNAEYYYKGHRELKQSTKAGWRNGLRLELYVGDPTRQQQYVYKSGIRVIVHNQSITPFPDQNGIDVSPGQQTNVAVSRTFINRLSLPYSDCVDELTQTKAVGNDLLIEMLSLISRSKVKKYEQEICLKICFQKYINSECNCSDFSLAFLSINNQSEGCYMSDQVECLSKANQRFYNGQPINECYSKCPIECSSIIYNTQVSTADVILLNLVLFFQFFVCLL